MRRTASPVLRLPPLHACGAVAPGRLPRGPAAALLARLHELLRLCRDHRCFWQTRRFWRRLPATP
eukprot:12785584-Alexandrium_andersonii.AAC.1